MKANKTNVPSDPSKLTASDYDDASVAILRVLDRRRQANSAVIRRETGLPKHKVEQRIRSDGILVRAGLVELAGYDETAAYAHPPKIMQLTQYAHDTIYHGFFDDDEDGTAQVILDQEQFADFAESLSALSGQLEELRGEVEDITNKYRKMSDFVVEDIFYEVAMIRYLLHEYGVPKEVMETKRAEYREQSRAGADLTQGFYEDN